jgi:hypothetical protein
VLGKDDVVCFALLIVALFIVIWKQVKTKANPKRAKKYSLFYFKTR